MLGYSIALLQLASTCELVLVLLFFTTVMVQGMRSKDKVGGKPGRVTPEVVTENDLNCPQCALLYTSMC